jgi:sigma-E factor negative regulatory protein RseA
MTKKHVDLTSALLDGELDHDAQRHAVSSILTAGVDERERFGRYQLIGDVMRGESAVLATDVAERVRAALQDEAVVLAPPARQTQRWLRPLGGLAVAASVAALAVVFAPQILTRAAPENQPVALTADVPREALAPLVIAENAPDVEQRRPELGARWQALDPALEERLNRLVIEHHEFGGRTGINGPVPHVGLVGYDAR